MNHMCALPIVIHVIVLFKIQLEVVGLSKNLISTVLAILSSIIWLTHPTQLNTDVIYLR